MHEHLLELERSFNRSVLTQVIDPLLTSHDIQLYLKRDDVLHPVISGNKWRKLKYILNHALSLNAQKIISMGGPFSNHLHALAYTGKKLGLATAAFIRGEPHANPTLDDLTAWGMEMTFISRSDYRELRSYAEWNSLPGLKPSEYWLPEGGALKWALQGVIESVAEIDQAYDMICVPCGTGTTLAGVIESAPLTCQILGFSALKGGHFIVDDVTKWLSVQRSNWRINTDYHFGGFAKTTPALTDFMSAFTDSNGIELDRVYTAKMMFGLYDLIKKRNIPPGQKIIAIHTGGMQGNRGFTVDATTN
ncbi:MAG: pyridoxal-phosphate dependent enzyme [Methylomicrobium sp.]|nr:pyridoxal-phosphate dependent enzyme [Methylomicrobium sp.]